LGVYAASIKCWYSASHATHAVTDHPDRGYESESVVLPPRGPAFFDGSTKHCPTVVQLPDRTFALFYIGSWVAQDVKVILIPPCIFH
jgi:hypothetical protein